MGTFLGHASTGFFFFCFGLWSFLRSLNLRCLSLMRTNDLFLAFPSSAFVWGGFVYTVGEALSALDDQRLSTSHLQHLIMSCWFTISGIVEMAHMFGFLQGNGFAIFMPVMWGVLSIMFYFHPQKTVSYQFGHSADAIVFGVVGLLMAIQVAVSFFSNAQHHLHQQNRLAMRERAKKSGSPPPSPQECPCQCGITNSRIIPVYTNPFPNSTVLPLLIGYLLMVVGTIDFTMAFDVFGLPGSKSSGNMGMDANMSMDMDGDWMAAEEAFLLHMLFNMVLQVALALCLKQVDKHFFSSPSSSSSSSRWKDDVSPYCISNLHLAAHVAEKTLFQRDDAELDV